MNKIRTILFLQFCLFVLLTNGQYKISGRINLGNEWQPKVYLAAINKLNDYYLTSPDMILNTAIVKADGSFELSGDNLPNDKRFYRLYAMKTQNTDYDACLYVGGDDHNFVHLILQNGEDVEIIADTNSIAPFGAFEINGSAENKAMRELSSIVYPSFYFYRIKFPTELKFSEDKFHEEIKSFADTCTTVLASLAAINNMDWDVYFDQDRAFFDAFAERLKEELPNSIYSKNYFAKLRYYADEEAPAMGIPSWLAVLLASLLLLSAAINIQLRKRITALEKQPATNEKLQDSLLLSLTKKEREILEYIHKGLSNKEIASSLFVELSTVKTHINKLYSKLGVANRREAQAIAKQLLK